MVRRLLITGATGGLGLALVEAARAQGLHVRATGRSTGHASRLAAMGAEFVRFDLTAPSGLAELCVDCDSVIHAAALSASWGARDQFERINVKATRTLLDAARGAGCRRFIFVSSPSIFASFRDRIGIRGSDPAASPPLNPYAATKLAAERLVLAASAPDMACCAIRPRAIVGPDDAVLLPRLTAMARRKHLPLPGHGQALIELTDVRDAARAILLAEDRAERITGRAINISGGQPVRVRDVAAGLAATLGENPRLINLPIPLARTLATLAEVFARAHRSPTEPVLTRYSLATLAYSQTFDQSEAREALGYHPQHDALATLLAEATKRAGDGR